MFDSLKYAKILEDSGLPRNQAETHIRILRDVIGEEMATKKDLNDGLLRLDTKMTNEFAQVRSEMVNLEHRLVIKLGGLMTVLMTLGLTANQMLS